MAGRSLGCSACEPHSWFGPARAGWCPVVVPGSPPGRRYGRLLVRVEAQEEGVASSGIVLSPEPSHNGAQEEARPPEGLPVGSQAPGFSRSGLHGETLTLDSLRVSGKPVMLIFTDPGCGPCNPLLPEVSYWQEDHAAKLTISLVSRGDPDDNRTKAYEHGLTSVLLHRDWEVSEAYQVNGTPSAVLVSPDGTIGSPVAGGAGAIRALVADAVGHPPSYRCTSRQARGSPAPTAGRSTPIMAKLPSRPYRRASRSESPLRR